MVTQEGYDPRDMKMTAQEFVLGRSGKWLSIVHFYKLPVPERRQEFVFGTAGEVMQMMGNLPSKVEMFGDLKAEPDPAGPAPDDEMAAAFQAAKTKGAAQS